MEATVRKEKPMGSWLGRGLLGLCAALTLAATAAVARADVLSDGTAAILVVPKIVVNSELHIDTLIRISNRSDDPVRLWCFYTNATPVCTNGTGNCLPGHRFADLEPCTPSTACQQQWQEVDFHVVLTQHQPVAWLASVGAIDCRRLPNQTGIDPDLDNNPPCFPLDGIFRLGEGGQSNLGSNVPPVAQDPFIGELKCVTVNEDDEPQARNDVYGNVTILGGSKVDTDVSGYNIIGIQALENNDGDKTLVLGRAGDEGVEYNGCPNILILDHFFDFAEDPITGVPVITDLTLVPCSEDFLHQQTFPTTTQFLVFNEFEQRFSTSRRVECFRDIQLSNIDTNTPTRSIFSAQVAGTLTGQTRIRGVVGSDPAYGNTLIGIAEEFRPAGTASVNLHAQGVRPQKDYIYLPPF